jgi:hypothetical protein
MAEGLLRKSAHFSIYGRRFSSSGAIKRETIAERMIPYAEELYAAYLDEIKREGLI